MVNELKPAEDGDREAHLDAPSHRELVDVVTAILRDSLDIGIEHAGGDLISSGLLDSLALVELLLELERVLGTTLMLDELEVDDFRNCPRHRAVRRHVSSEGSTGSSAPGGLHAATRSGRRRHTAHSLRDDLEQVAALYAPHRAFRRRRPRPPRSQTISRTRCSIDLGRTRRSRHSSTTIKGGSPASSAAMSGASSSAGERFASPTGANSSPIPAVRSSGRRLLPPPGLPQRRAGRGADGYGRRSNATHVDEARRRWPAQPQSLSWFRLFRPISFVTNYSLMSDVLRRWPRSAQLVATRSRPAACRRTCTTPGANAHCERNRCHRRRSSRTSAVSCPGFAPPMTTAFVEWLLHNVASVGARGTLVSVGLRDEEAIVGWYVYFLRPGGISDVLQVAGARARGAVSTTSLRDARGRGAALLRGRIERVSSSRSRPAGVSSATTAARSCMPASPRSPRHSPIPDTLLTRLDGEWWMGHHLESFT